MKVIMKQGKNMMPKRIAPSISVMNSWNAAVGMIVMSMVKTKKEVCEAWIV